MAGNEEVEISEVIKFDVVAFALRRKGLDAVLAGKPIEGEGFFRTALLEELPDTERVRFLVCLGDALIDQGLYDEAEQQLALALAVGDATGSAQGSMADVLLLKKNDPERALYMAEQSFALSDTRRTRADHETLENLRGARLWARRAQAYLQMNRRDDAEDAVKNAVALAVEAHACDREPDEVGVDLAELLAAVPLRRLESLAFAATHWRIGAALAAMGEGDRAAEHFRIAWNADRGGKYRLLAEKALNQIGAPAARTEASRLTR
jgi:tetratricopeptide (TPR) repeat protein